MALTLTIAYEGSDEYDQMVLVGDQQEYMLDLWADMAEVLDAEVLVYLDNIDLTYPDTVEALLMAFEQAVPFLADPGQGVVPGDDAMVMLKRASQASQYLGKALDWWDDIIEIGLRWEN